MALFQKSQSTLAAGLLCVFVLYLRMRSNFYSPQFWGEDGVVFWFQQASLGWKAIFVTHAGYYHLVPRLVAAAASFFDGSQAPVLFFVGYMAFCFWAAATAASTVQNPLLGAFLGAGLALPPNGIGEVLGTITNAQWILAPTLALLLLPGAVSVNRIAYAGVLSLTGPFSVLLAPIAAYRFWASKDIVSAIILGGAAIQIVAISQANPSPYVDGEGTLKQILATVAFRPFMYSTVCAALGAGIILAALQSQMREFRLVLIYFAIVASAATIARFLNNPSLLLPETNSSRYFYIPRVVLIWCAISIAFINWRNAVLSIAFILSLELSGTDHLIKPPLSESNWSARYKAEDAEIKTNPDGWIVTIPGRSLPK